MIYSCYLPIVSDKQALHPSHTHPHGKQIRHGHTLIRHIEQDNVHKLVTHTGPDVRTPGLTDVFNMRGEQMKVFTSCM